MVVGTEQLWEVEVGWEQRCLRHKKQECFIGDHLLFGGLGLNRNQDLLIFVTEARLQLSSCIVHLVKLGQECLDLTLLPKYHERATYTWDAGAMVHLCFFPTNNVISAAGIPSHMNNGNWHCIPEGKRNLLGSHHVVHKLEGEELENPQWDSRVPPRKADCKGNAKWLPWERGGQPPQLPPLPPRGCSDLVSLSLPWERHGCFRSHGPWCKLTGTGTSWFPSGTWWISSAGSCF